MTNSIIYGYIEDTIFQPKSFIDFGENIIEGLGYLNDNLVNYFSTKAILNDPRTSRLNVLGKPVPGIIRVLFDKDKVDDIDVITSLSAANQTKLFNIIERILYSDQASIDAINTDLSSENQYSIYQNNSLVYSSYHTQLALTLDASTTVNILIRHSFSFAVSIDGTLILFKLWIKDTNFENEYPLSTITQVIPAAPPDHFLDLSKFKDILGAIITSSDFKFTRMHPEIKYDDHSGLCEYYTKFVISSSNTRLVPFGILYKGAKPSTLEIRKAIREYLHNLGITQDDVWMSLFPDIFIIAEFYLIPVWSNKIRRLEREIYPSILPTYKFLNPITILFPNMSSEWIDRHTEIITNSKTEQFTLTVPDINNDPLYYSLLRIHPTYQNHGPDHSTFGFMEEHTQDFGRKLAKAISILVQETFITDEFLNNTIVDKNWLSFTSNRIEYHVLYESDFPV
jgi:hypothetical protein